MNGNEEIHETLSFTIFYPASSQGLKPAEKTGSFFNRPKKPSATTGSRRPPLRLMLFLMP